MTHEAVDDLPGAEGLGLSSASIEKIADHFRKVLRIDDPTKVDFYRVVDDLGGEVKVVPSTEREFHKQGTLEVREGDGWVVYIPEHTSPLDDRFTLAHELGHFVIHSKLGEKSMRAFRRFDSRDPISPAEVEADAFALSLLMPRNSFSEAMKSFGADVEILAAEFHVDVDAAAARRRWIEKDQAPDAA